MRAGRNANAARGTLRAALHVDRNCEQWRRLLLALSEDRQAARGASERATAIARCRSTDDKWRAAQPDAHEGPRARAQSATRPGACVLILCTSTYVLPVGA